MFVKTAEVSVGLKVKGPKHACDMRSDEPTTGLDARAAQIVMRVVRSIGNNNRTIVCTIHQPSTEIFLNFDELLLLTRKGHQIFYGPLGPDSQNLVDYFQSVPGAMQLKAGYNPATYMLEVCCSWLKGFAWLHPLCAMSKLMFVALTLKLSQARHSWGETRLCCWCAVTMRCVTACSAPPRQRKRSWVSTSLKSGRIGSKRQSWLQSTHS
jgi:hypothetical protein